MNPTAPLPMDELTGFLSRRSLLEEFEQRMAHARSSSQPLSLAFIDIDEFLVVNETYGHVAGDSVLQAVAEALSQTMGPEVIYSRYGGDEYVLLMPGLEREAAFLALERGRDAVEKMAVKVPGKTDTISGVTISTGIASFPVDGRARAELMRKADQALYRAKASGRNQVRLAYEERMTPKTVHFTQTQLERLASLANDQRTGEAELLREALDDLLAKYGINDIES